MQDITRVMTRVITYHVSRTQDDILFASRQTQLGGSKRIYHEYSNRSSKDTPSIDFIICLGQEHCNSFYGAVELRQATVALGLGYMFQGVTDVEVVEELLSKEYGHEMNSNIKKNRIGYKINISDISTVLSCAALNPSFAAIPSETFGASCSQRLVFRGRGRGRH